MSGQVEVALSSSKPGNFLKMGVMAIVMVVVMMMAARGSFSQKTRTAALAAVQKMLHVSCFSCCPYCQI